MKTSAGSSLTSCDEHLEEGDVVGVDCVDRLTRAVEEFHFRRVSRLCERIDLDLLHQRHRLVGLSVYLEPAQEIIDAICRRLDDEVTLRHLARVVRRKEEVFAALSFVGAERTDVHEKPLQRVHRGSQHFRRRFHHRRAITLQIQKAHPVNRLGIRREDQRLGVHERFPDDDLI